MADEAWTELMQAARGGDARAYDRFLRAVAPALRAFCRISMILPSSVPVKSRSALDKSRFLTCA